jgi:chemotaxis protein CheX
MALNKAVVEKLGMTEVDLTSQLAGDVCEIFATMVGVEDIQHVIKEAEATSHFKNSVTAMVGLAGTCNGIVCLHTSQTLALSLTAQMLGMDISEVNDDVDDALGEIANMVGGSFKHHLSNNGDDIKLSTPSVVTGTDYSFSSGRSGDALTVVFSANGEEFLVSIVLEVD